ncbi:aminomethyl-transferring glycine dehydrogenase [Aquirufa antheringensis]|jgi:glycine dehydrogenase|uniref:aminomethyl-transferring glycine dehydrogenase n=1 Tax=Aquirufa antheringensis TaxID=2516559 RepID=UPI0022A831C6|nr:aminomethyl-transferring glycine dehydrogenase [Aquirufa antheringensis]MCZ2488194.1 aminomethyl-transferring glycine dehydrogenase [Aquirufa antheringensis]MCZ2490264.1 aminomethyl-transferring glycine dehydrogenase [Aquirufa antheringensis]
MTPNYSYQEDFSLRHNNVEPADVSAMLKTIGVDSLDTLIQQTVPAKIRLEQGLRLPDPKTEFAFLRDFKAMMGQNQIFKSHIGLGYSDTIVPTVILRNILENPSWYTAYTPYQAEIAQGRLEMLLNYQTMIIDLTGMELANASLLDEGTAAAEAMTMLYGQRPAERNSAEAYFVSELCLPQTIDLLKTRAEPIGIEIIVGDHRNFDVTDARFYGMMLQYPASNGEVFDYSALIAAAKENGLQVVVAADLLALTLLTPPGEMGADAVVGVSQRFGVPMGFGGPHAGFFATKEKYKRNIPGRIIGVSVDAEGNRALRMALQTREQHIRREKATSNICTAQVLLSIMAASYAIYHGPQGLKKIAEKIYGLTELLAVNLRKLGFVLENTNHFDTLTIQTGAQTSELRALAEKAQRNLRYTATTTSISLDETTQEADVIEIISFFETLKGAKTSEKNVTWAIPAALTRTSTFLTHSVFNKYHSEHGMLRYLKSLESKDLSMVHSMISLGSCTMKLNATTEMIPVTWPELGKIHPFAPASQTKGYQQLVADLNEWLCEITGFAKMSMQPNSGAQGEYAGLMTIRAYHASRGDHHRNIAIIPSSAHGTNPASAVMAGMKVIVSPCDANGNIDVADLKAKALEHKDNLSCLMVTYPSTHGVFEETIQEICAIIHENGGQVYMDGANMNAQVGLTSPARIGADVCHLNLHKTFCIPHGGGGPGMGPIGVAPQLVPFLPGHVNDGTSGAVSAAPVGSASILAISYAYIAMMGGKGLTTATETAILNANYIKARLEKEFPILYTGSQGRCAHEMIVDCRPFKLSAGVEAEDIAKRLMDYGFHAPTLSFPVAGTLMIEPTESENKDELDRFCDSLLSIRAEIREIEEGKADKASNVLKHAPHTQSAVLLGDWDRPYSREKAVFPLAYVKANKFWPTVSRIDSAYGDRNLVCACEPTESYM